MSAHNDRDKTQWVKATNRTPSRRSILFGGTTLATATALSVGALHRVAQAQQPAANLSASPSWTRALPSGPDARGKVTEDYVKHVARDAYFWAWPLVNM